MEISPIKIFYMVAASVFLGICAGALNDLNRIVRMLFGQTYGKSGFGSLYNIKLPISRRQLGEMRKYPQKRGAFYVVVFFQDVILFFASAVGISLLNYYFNNGRARIFTPVAVIIGFLIYYFTVGKLILYLSDIPIALIMFIIISFFEILHYPLRYFVKKIGFFVEKIYINIDKAIAKRQKRVYNNNKEKSVMINAEHGFIDIAKE